MATCGAFLDLRCLVLLRTEMLLNNLASGATQNERQANIVVDVKRRLKQ
jgi:hypothetical protein